MTEGIKKPLRALFRTAMQFYPREYGKYSILMRLYFPYLAPTSPTKEVVTLHDGIRMELVLNEYLQSQLYLFGEFEPATVKVLKRLVKSGDTVLDIGANVGYISLVLAKCVGKSGKVFSFEPDSKNFALLNRNIALNPDCYIKPIALAVSDTHQLIRLYQAKFDFNGGAHSILPSEKHSTDFVEIEATTIDDFAQSHKLKKIDVIKIDIEGAEMKAFNGMTETLRNSRPLIVCELCEEHQVRAGYTTQAVKKWMAETFDMQAFKVMESGKLKETPIEETHLAENIVFVPHERVQEVKAFL
jgi:FkbM family methyltransferase